MTSATFNWCCTMSLKAMPCAAFGVDVESSLVLAWQEALRPTTNRYTVAASSTTDTAIVTARNRSTPPSVTS